MKRDTWSWLKKKYKNTKRKLRNNKWYDFIRIQFIKLYVEILYKDVLLLS